MTTYSTSRALWKPAGHGRVVVGGVDITWFRVDFGVFGPHMPTKVPGYQLTEPFGYGASDPLVIPRTNSMFESYGSGDLAWIKKGASVLYQRVDDEGNILATDYRGIVIAVRTSERNITLDVAGEVSGRAALKDRPQPVVRSIKDVGTRVAFGLAEIDIPLTPALGPTTNITVPDQGGMTWLAWLQSLGALSQSRAGIQRAIMPNPWGTGKYRFAPKEMTEVHLTLFADGQRIRLDLVDDAAEQPNIFYGNGVDPNGTRWRNVRRPGLFQGPAAPYPFEDDRNFGLGTNDTDTDTGDGITVLHIKLRDMGFLDPGENPDETTYTGEMYDAVMDLKNEAGLSDNGTMTPNAWKALWNLEVTGYSNAGTKQFPIFQAPETREFNYSANGSVIGRNPAYDPTVLPVERTIDFGVCTKKRAIDYCRGLWTRSQGKNWAGTATLNQAGGFWGEHDDSDYDTLTADDIAAPRDIRPGMNVWLPYFDGGTLFHISGVNVSEDGSATLTIDTQARDLLELREILDRNRESRRNFRREWAGSNQANKPSGNMIARDEDLGLLPNDVALNGNQWNIVMVPVGQSGTISRTYAKTFASAAEFAMVVVAAEWDKPARFQRAFGNPLRAVDPDVGETWIDADNVQDLLDDKIVLFAEGTSLQPCGFGHRTKYQPNGDRSRFARTGVHISDSTYTYQSIGERRAVVTLGIYPDRDCILRHGRLLYALEDDVN